MSAPTPEHGKGHGQDLGGGAAACRKPYVCDTDFTLYQGDALDVLRELPDESVHCCVTSPPYWGLRDYGAEGQLGLEATPEEYVAGMVAVFSEVRRVLRSDGTLWLNIGDSYVSDPGKGGSGTPNGRNNRGEGYARERIAQVRDGKAVHGDVLRPFAVEGLRPKNLVGIPWRLAFALQADGWYLRSDIIWSKPNPMPESVTDRPTKAHEYVFLLSKSARYFFDQEAVREGYKYDGRNVLDREAGAGSHENHRTNGGKRNRWPGLGQTAAARRDTIDGGHVESEPMEINHGGRNVRSVWEIATQPYAEAHFATFPEALVERCVKAGCPHDGTVLDPFLGSGTTSFVARKLGRRSIGIELNPDYCNLAGRRLQQQSLLAGTAAWTLYTRHREAVTTND